MGRACAGIGQGLRDALATPDLRRLQLSSVASSTGGWAFMVALSVYAYEAGGAAAVGLAALVRMLPAGLAAPFVGLVADRRSRRDVLVASSAGRAVVVAAITAAVAAPAPLAVVLALAALLTVLQTAQRPGQAALLAQLARTPVELAAANAAWSGLDNASFLLGALLGGVLIAAAGTTIVFGVTAGTFVVAAVALARIARDPVPEHRAGATSPRELAGGLRAVRGDPALALVIGAVAVTTFVEGIVDVLVVVSALTILHLGDAGVGWLNAAWGAGGLAGGVAGLALLHRGRLAAGLAGGAALAGVALVAVAALPMAGAALALLVLFGIGYALIDIAELTLVQRLASDELLARAFGVTETLYWITTGLGAAVAPLLIAWLGARGALAVAGACLLALVALRARAGWPAWRTCARCPSGRSRCCAASASSPRCRSARWRTSRCACARTPRPPARRSCARAISVTASTSSMAARWWCTPTGARSRGSDRATASARSRCCAGCRGWRRSPRPSRSRSTSWIARTS